LIRIRQGLSEASIPPEPTAGAITLQSRAGEPGNDWQSVDLFDELWFLSAGDPFEWLVFIEAHVRTRIESKSPAGQMPEQKSARVVPG
jgi:hypothetical protein